MSDESERKIQRPEQLLNPYTPGERPPAWLDLVFLVLMIGGIVNGGIWVWETISGKPPQTTVQTKPNDP